MYRSPFTNEGQIWYAIADPRYTISAKFRLGRFILSLSGGEKVAKTPIFAVFWTSAFSVSPVGSSLRKLNTGAQQQTFGYPTASKPILYSNAFMVKPGAQSLTFKTVTDRQTDRQTKNSTFLAPLRRVKSEPYQTWHGDRGPRARSCTSKTFGGLTHSFAARGH